jgi:hypothetical protein
LGSGFWGLVLFGGLVLFWGFLAGLFILQPLHCNFSSAFHEKDVFGRLKNSRTHLLGLQPSLGKTLDPEASVLT